MANQNFIVHNGLTVGATTIFAGNGDVITSGNLTLTSGNLNLASGGIQVNQISEGTSTVAVNTNFVNVTASGSKVGVFSTAGLSASAVYSPTIGNTGAQLTGTIQTASQPNITTLGGLTSIGAAGLSIGGVTSITTNTQNTGVNSGALQVTGGAYVGANLYVGGNLTVAGNVTTVNYTYSTEFLPNLAVIGAPLNFTAFNANLQYGGSNNSYLQFAMQNTNNGTAATTDLVAFANNGNVDAYIDFGITSSTYSQSGYGLTQANDGYIYVQGNTTVNGGNLVLSTYTNKDIVFSTGGGDTGNEIGRFSNSSASLLMIGNVTSTTSNAASLGTSSLWWKQVWGTYYGTWNGGIVSPTYGGTGVNNGSNQINTSVNLNLNQNLNTANSVSFTNMTVTPGATGVTNGLYVNGGDVTASRSTSTGVIFLGSNGSHYLYFDGTNYNMPSGNWLPTGTGSYNLGSSSQYFATMYGQATTAQYADLAENYQADSAYTPGTVLEFGGEYEVTLSQTNMSNRVAGVVSTDPAHLMNAKLTGENVVALALTGRVPCRVQGIVRKGDMMVSAGNGCARAEANPSIGSVIGKAVEDHDGLESIIEVVVGRL